MQQTCGHAISIDIGMHVTSVCDKSMRLLHPYYLDNVIYIYKIYSETSDILGAELVLDLHVWEV